MFLQCLLTSSVETLSVVQGGVTMPNYGATEKVRSFVAENYIEPARQRGEGTVTIHAGSLSKVLQEHNILPPNRFPIICGAMGSPIFAKKNHLSLDSRQGPSSGLSSTATFTFTLKPIAPSPNSVRPVSSQGDGTPPVASQSSFLSLRGLLKATYKKLGGAESFHRRESENWDR